MTDGDFWSLIALVEVDAGGEALTRLEAALHRRPAHHVEMFAREVLRRAAHLLDAAVTTSGPLAVVGGGPRLQALSVLARGRQTAESARADPVLVLDEEPTVAEELLIVASCVHEELIGEALWLDDPHARTRHDYDALSGRTGRVDERVTN